MYYRLLTLLAIAALLVVSCTKEDVTVEPAPGNNNPSNNGSTTAIVYNVDKTRLLQLVNNVRQAGCNCGSTYMRPVAVVTWNDKLAKAAFDHSAEMKANEYFSHTGLNGSNAGQRINAAGYAWKTYGENIARGYANEQAVMNGWLSSEGHCKNIMNGSFKEMGAGRQGDYWTQLFGAR